jgi:hypothetical protein
MNERKPVKPMRMISCYDFLPQPRGADHNKSTHDQNPLNHQNGNDRYLDLKTIFVALMYISINSIIC